MTLPSIAYRLLKVREDRALWKPFKEPIVNTPTVSQMGDLQWYNSSTINNKQKHKKKYENV
jgi:hypothetical protein